MKEQAQAGLEYLMTYGWALILIAAIIGALVFIFAAPEQSSFTSTDPTKIAVKGSTITNGSAIIKMQNISGGKIEITGLNPQGYYECTINGAEPVGIKIGPGGEITIRCVLVGDEAGSIEIGYKDFAGLSKTITVSEDKPRNPESTNVVVAGLETEEIVNGGIPPSQGWIANSAHDVINTPTDFDFTTGCNNGSCQGYKVLFADGGFAGQEFEIMSVFQGTSCYPITHYDPRHSCARLQNFNAVGCMVPLNCTRFLDPAWNFSILKPE